MVSHTSNQAVIESLLLKAEDNDLYRTDPDEFLGFAARVWKEAERVKDFHSVARGKLSIAAHSVDSCEYDKTLKFCREARRTFEVTSDNRRCAEAFDYEGRALMLSGRYVEGLEAFLSGLRFVTPDDVHRHGSLYHGIAMLSLLRGDLFSSLENDFHAMQVLREGDEKRLRPFILYSSAVVLRANRQDALAADLLAEAEAMLRKDTANIADRNGRGVSHFDLQLMGDVLTLSEKHKEALPYYERAYDPLHNFHCQVTETECIVALAQNSLKLHEDTDSSNYFNKALALATTLKNKSLLARVRLAYSDLLQVEGKEREAASSLTNILVFARGTRNIALQLNACERLARLEESRKNFSSSSTYYREANELLREQWIPLYQSRVSTLPSSSGSLPLATSSTAQNEVLQLKAEQIDTLQSDLNLRDSILLVLRSKLREILLMKEDQKELGLREILSKLGEHLDAVERGTKLREGLLELNEDFAQRLTLRYPLLTATELQVCSLIAVGFANQEIEQLLSLSNRTLECHRYRIRTKMQLKRNEKLEVTLHRFNENSHRV